MATDLTTLVSTIQQSNALITQIIGLLQKGVLVTTNLPTYTVAGLPATAAVGAMAYATNGRKSGEGAGVGTGVPVWFNASNQWFAMWSSALVTS